MVVRPEHPRIRSNHPILSRRPLRHPLGRQNRPHLKTATHHRKTLTHAPRPDRPTRNGWTSQKTFTHHQPDTPTRVRRRRTSTRNRKRHTQHHRQRRISNNLSELDQPSSMSRHQRRTTKPCDVDERTALTLTPHIFPQLLPHRPLLLRPRMFNSGH